MERSWNTQQIQERRERAAGLLVSANYWWCCVSLEYVCVLTSNICIHPECVSVCVTAGTYKCVYFFIMCVCVCERECIRAWTCTYWKHEIICDQHQSKSLFFLSVAYRPLIIHACLPAPSSKVGNSIFSLRRATHTFPLSWRGCVWKIKESISPLYGN